MTEGRFERKGSSTIRRLRRAFWKLLGWAVILSAVLVGIGRLAAPHADRLRPLVEAALSERLGQPVSIRRISASWPRFSPMLELEGLTLGPESAPQLQIERSRAELRLYKLVLPSQNMLELVVVGLELALVQGEDGGWQWRLDRGGRVAGDWQRTLAAGDLLVRDARLLVRPRAMTPVVVELPQARLRRTGATVEIWLDARLQNAPIERLEARLRLALDDAGIRRVQSHAVAPTLRPLTGTTSTAGSRLQGWLDWDRANGARIHLRGQVRDPDASAGQAGDVGLVLDGRWDAQGIAVELNAEPGPEARSGIRGLALSASGSSYGLVAEELDLGFLHALVEPWVEDRHTAWPRRLDGRVRGLAVVWSPDSGVSRSEGLIEGFALALDRPEISVTGVSLRLGLAGDRPTLELGGTPSLNIPRLYDRTIELRRIDGRLEWLPGGIAFSGVDLEHEEFELNVDGELLRTANGPFFDLQVGLPRLASDDLHRWLPLEGIPPNTRRWLERALVSVAGASADTVLFGRPLTWKRRVPNGALESRVRLGGLVLDYAPGWPLARNLQGELRFLGESLLARIDRGELAGQVLRAPRVEIRRFRAAEVELELESAGGDAASLARLSRSFPLPAAREALETMQWSGPASAGATLWLPVRHLRDWRLLGQVELEDVQLDLPGPEITVAAIRGGVPFTRDRFGEAVLVAQIAGLPAEIRLEAQVQPRLDLSIESRLAPVGLVPARWRRDLPELTDAIRGTSPVSLRIANTAQEYGESMMVQLSSTLQGTAIDLPEPLNKPVEASWPLRLWVPLGEPSIPYRVDLQGVASALVLSGDRPQLGLGFGDAPARLPAAEDFLIEGRIGALDLPGWVGVLGRAASGISGASTGASDVGGWLKLEVDELLVGRQDLGRARLDMQREADSWRFVVEGERLAGTVRLPGSISGDRDLVVDFERLYWPLLQPTDGLAPAPPSAIDPSRLPAVNLAIRDLRWGELDLGEARLASHRVEAGIEVERFSLSAPGLEINGSGRWSGPEQPDTMPSTGVSLRLNSVDLGLHLAQAGFDLGLERGKAAVEFVGRWPGSPWDFALQRVSGTLAIRIQDGAIPAARPGAGRLLGLVSLSSIPRRLRLDFSDVFGDGLGFDRMTGDFVLTDGLARTNNLRIEAPAADIRISGLTDLGQRRYDQQVVVRPGLGATLPVIGALAGGPVGAAAGAALQQILSRPLQGMSEVRYTVTGTWDEPAIEPLREPSSPDDGG